ncbi:hypothetical protein SAMN05444274_106138 [Mariniphaga anaerophila]|uniref:DUF5916 domain-containing protein n=1 Tax=Mariniphaga anaerophila TaxID=1484053 RepID=A0A1M5CI64_9BACT|nr:DUF5916 domain-containing protein [Mariniphaga anaerophila]SHF54465.1 hypothetical protein SAMN05444274_106138 [Mariniphaga anaerophila]
MKLTFLLLLAAFIGTNAVALPFQKLKNDTISAPFNKDFVYHVKKMHAEITIDGQIDEPDWLAAEKADNFYKVLPVDTGFATQPSEILITYDDKALYMAQIFYDTIPGKRVMESYRRDFSFGNNDNLLVFFDTFLDQTNGFSFGVSASGAKWDGTMSDGSAVNLDWDCKWESKTKHYDDRWVTEMRIPFKSIRYPSGSRKWYTNFSRLDLKANEKSSWAPVPRQFPTASLAYTGVMNFEEPLPKSKMMFSLIPYVFGGYSNDFEHGTGNVWKKDFGFDAKVGFSSSMNLDLTYNPDFAQVEVDQQVTNIDRFELFFPEKRQFFLENSDLFSGFGDNNINPFFSRRIGLDAPVLAGARLSGKVGNNWRVGFMNMATKETNDFLARNFTVASIQKKVFARSNFGFILVNKEYIDQPSDTTMYNRVAGFDYNLASKDNIWNGKFFYHQSFQPGNPDKQFAQGFGLTYNTKNLQLEIMQRSVGENYRAEAGYVPRTGYNYISPEVTYLFVPNKKVVSHGIVVDFRYYFDPDFHKIDHENNISYQFEFQNRSSLVFGYQDHFVELQQDFDPTHKSESFLPAGSKYNFGGAFINYTSTRKTLFNWNAEIAKGTFYTGNIQYITGELGYRYQPYVNLSVNFNYTDMKLGQPFEHTKMWLVGPKMDVTFTDKLFWTTFVQYNEQIDNMNINMRLQWRYAPVSDFFVVYTDNYLPGSWNSRNRALVLKLTYWLN